MFCKFAMSVRKENKPHPDFEKVQSQLLKVPI